MAVDAEVLVVGAGPVGMFLALGLKRRGVDVRIVDKAQAGPGAPKAAVLWPRAQALLAELDALGPFAARGVEVRRTAVWAGARPLGTLRFGGSGAPARYPLAIEQHDTERLLRRALADAGVAVQHGAEAVALRQGDGFAEVELQHASGANETVRARWLVGCDGAHSFLRKAAGIAFPGRARRNLQVLQVDATPDWDRTGDPHGGAIVLAPGVSVSVYPMPGGSHRIFAFAHDPEPRPEAPPTLTEMERLLADAAGLRRVRLQPAERVWLNRARFQDRTAARLHAGRVLLCGDAAHVWAPVGGHGMNVGLYGAEHLARRLAAVLRDGADPQRALSAYAVSQRRLAGFVRRATRFDVLEQPPGPLRLAALRAVMPALLAWPAFHRAVDAALGDLHLSPALTGRPSLASAWTERA